MEVPGIQAQCDLIFNRVTHVELMRAHHHTFGTDTKQLTLNRIDMVRRVQLLSKDLIQTVRQSLAVALTIRWHIFHPIWHPNIHHTSATKLLAHRCANDSTALTVFDPKRANLWIRMT